MRPLLNLAGLALMTVLGMGLAACGDKPQVKAATSGKAAYLGTSSAAYTAPGWKVGDATSWDANMRSRTQAGQNEYPRTAGH
jgi:hypothetical protein